MQKEMPAGENLENQPEADLSGQKIVKNGETLTKLSPEQIEATRQNTEREKSALKEKITSSSEGNKEVIGEKLEAEKDTNVTIHEYSSKSKAGGSIVAEGRTAYVVKTKNNVYIGPTKESAEYAAKMMHSELQTYEDDGGKVHTSFSDLESSLAFYNSERESKISIQPKREEKQSLRSWIGKNIFGK
jgi:hypothetical protein